MRPRVFNPNRYAAVYENPTNGWREATPKLAWLWMFLFGVFYMAARSLWRPLIVSMLILMATSLIMWPLLIFVAPVVWIATAAQAQSLIRARYMRMGWSEIDPFEQERVTY